MRIDAGIIAVALTLMLSFHPKPAAAGEDSLEDFTVADILERIERYQRNGLTDARQWYAGLKRMDGPAAYLELALLEVYGPEDVRNRRSGLKRMTKLEQGETGQLSQEARRLLAVLAAQVETGLAAESECRDLARRLAEESHAHRETREKLEALRMIERQLEMPLDESEPYHGHD